MAATPQRQPDVIQPLAVIIKSRTYTSTPILKTALFRFEKLPLAAATASHCTVCVFIFSPHCAPMGYIVCGTKLTKLNACSCCVCRRYTDCGTVLSWGDGSNYKLGHGDTSDQSTPKRIESFAASGIRIVDIACGEQHSMAVDDQGSLYCWGVGREGQLGIGPGRHKLRMPTRIPQSPFEGRRIIRIASNSCFSLVVTEDGRAYSFGWGASGRLGHGDDKQRLFPCLIQSLDREFIVDVACGWRHTLLLNSRGELFSMGRNR